MAAKRERKAGSVARRVEISAGGVVWRRGSSGDIEVVLIRPAGGQAWALPKGHVEKGEHVIDAAMREVHEETGLDVGGAEKLGDVSYVFSWHDQPSAPLVRIFKRVYFFLMECRGGSPAQHDAETEEVAWMPIDEAIARATYNNERELLKKARSVLAVR
jgi:8-oxo-dGTP pyrophosphatase MutT (NUDIX family)